METSNTAFELKEIIDSVVSSVNRTQPFDEVKIQCYVIQNGGRLIDYQKFGYSSLKELLKASGNFEFEQANEKHTELIVPLNKQQYEINKNWLENNGFDKCKVVKYKNESDKITAGPNIFAKDSEVCSLAREMKQFFLKKVDDFTEQITAKKDEAKQVHLNGVNGNFKVRVEFFLCTHCTILKSLLFTFSFLES